MPHFAPRPSTFLAALCPAGAVAPNVPQAADAFLDAGLLPAVFSQLAEARQASDYWLWSAVLMLVSNCTRFKGERGDALRRRFMEEGGCAACA